MMCTHLWLLICNHNPMWPTEFEKFQKMTSEKGSINFFGLQQNYVLYTHFLVNF